MGAVAVGALLIALLLAIAAAMVWQEIRTRSSGDPVTYVVDEAARFVHDRLREPTRRRLDLADVRRILEWDLYHARVIETGESVLGSGDSIEYILERSRESGLDYDPLEVGEVIAAESDYLFAIGAIGDRVEEDST